jgi:hypothetical protein
MSVPVERYHYVPEALTLLKKMRPFPGVRRQKVEMKPKGLWYSVEGNGEGWADWCRVEGFRLEQIAFRHRIEVDLDRMVVIRSVEEYDRFVEEYARYIVLRNSNFKFRHKDYVDWPTVAARFDGIEIAPYLWERRLDSGLWYYGWDCASGVVWRRRAIRLLGPAEETPCPPDTPTTSS